MESKFEDSIAAFGQFLVDLQSLITLDKARTLATAFNFRPAEFDNIERSSNPGHVFVELLRDKGIINNSDISRLIKTLKSCYLDGVADYVIHALTRLQLYDVVKTEWRTILRAKILFLQELRRKYKNLYDAVQPIPYIRDRLFCVNRVFVEGGVEYLISDRNTRKEESWCKLASYQDIFSNARVKSDRRIIEGEPGFGKSTLTLQLAYDWCEGTANGLADKYEIVIFLKLKQLGGVKSIFKAIKWFILPSDSILTEEDIKHIFIESKKVLIILDGFDEYPDRDSKIVSDIKRIIKRDMFQEFDVLLLTRTACLPEETPPHTQRIRLTGFDQNAQDEYIRKAVVGNDERAVEAIKRLLLENPVLADLCQVPLFFVMVAHMSHESEHLKIFKSVTSFFSYMIKCFHNHLKNKMRDENVQGIETLEDDHSDLDRVAFEGLCKANQQPLWGKEDLRKRLGEDSYHQYVRLGILVEEDVLDVESSYGSMVVSNLVPVKTEVRFYHKLFCEWYAAHHLSTYASNSNIRYMGNDGKVLRRFHAILGRKDISDILKELDPFDLQYVFRFACGLNSDASCKIIEHLKNTENAHQFAILCLLEKAGNVDTILGSVRDLCSHVVGLNYGQQLLLQRSTIQLLNVASSNGISISCVWLNNCYSTVDLRGGNHLQLKSNLSIPVLTTLNELVIDIRDELREMTSEELTGILQYTSKCLASKKLMFFGCLLPPSVQTESVSVLRSRNVKVIWVAPVNVYELNLQSCQWEHNVESYGNFKEDIVRLLGDKDCLQLADYFGYSTCKLEKLKQNIPMSKAFVFTLEEDGIIHQSNVSQLEAALALLGINLDCYNKVCTFEKTIGKITLYDTFVANLSSHIDVSTAGDLCDYFEFSNERKVKITSSQNPGQSILFALDELNIIKPDNTAALEYPLRHLPLIQALALLHDYQSSISAKNHEEKNMFVDCLKRKMEHLYEAMTPVPWKRSCEWKSSDLFVSRKLILKDFESTKTSLDIDEESKVEYTKIFSHRKLVSEKRIKLEGDPGSGKTMLTIQLAYDWAQGELKNVDILIWLPLKFVNDKTLVQSIKEFYIPKQTSKLEANMEEVLSSQTKVIAVLLDGLEEYKYSTENDESEVMQVFKGKKHPNWKVVLTSRSNYAHQYLPSVPVVELDKFGNHERNDYIEKACKGDLNKQRKIETTINDNQFIHDLCSVPLLFVLLVHNLEAVDIIKDGNFERVGPLMESMISTLVNGTILEGKIIDPSSESSSVGSMSLGEIAFSGLCMERQQLLWQRQFLENYVRNFRGWIDSGVLVIEDIFATTALNGLVEPSKSQWKDFSETTIAKTFDTCHATGSFDSKGPTEDALLEELKNSTTQESTSSVSREDVPRVVEVFKTKVKEQHMEAPEPLDFIQEPKDDDCSQISPTEDSELSEMKRFTTKQVKGNITQKHVPQEVRFLHKVIQEWFAATYFSFMMKNCTSKLQYAKLIYDHLFLIDPADLQYVLRFSCHLHPPFCRTVMNHLFQRNKSNDDGKLPDYIMNCIFLCFAELPNAKDADIVEIVSDVCKEDVVIYSQDSRLLQRAKATFLEFASKSKILIQKVLLNGGVKDVTKFSIVLSSGASLRILDTLQTVEVIVWSAHSEEHLQDIVDIFTKSQQIMEIVCLFPYPPPSDLTEETKLRIRERKVTVKWMVGENVWYTYDSRKGEWMFRSQLPLNEHGTDKHQAKGGKSPIKA